MALKDIEFLVNWARNNLLVVKILSSKLSCTHSEIKTMLGDLAESASDSYSSPKQISTTTLSTGFTNEPKKEQVNKLTLKKR